MSVNRRNSPITYNASQGVACASLSLLTPKTRGVATTLTPPQLLTCGRRGSTPIGYGVGGRLLTLGNLRLGF